MGHFYVTITLRGPNQDQVLRELTRQERQAYVSPTINHFTVVYDAECDDQDTAIIATLTAQLSTTFACPAFAVLNHDDDLLWYELYDRGQCLDTYNSNPALFDSALQSADPSGGNASHLCRALGSPHGEQVAAILRRPTTADDDYLFAVERHQALVQLLGLPNQSVGFGYEYIAEDDLPIDMTSEQFKHT